MNLLTLLIPRPSEVREEGRLPSFGKAKRRRWHRERRRKGDRIASAQRLDQELRERRAAWAASLSTGRLLYGVR